MLTVVTPLKVWIADGSRMHFITIPSELSGEIRAHAMLVRRGFGSVRVEATIGDVTWRTSVFPSKGSGSYFLPVKIEVCRKADIRPDDPVTAQLELL